MTIISVMYKDSAIMPDIKFSNFPLAGIASVGATVFTNPLEVCPIYIYIQFTCNLWNGLGGQNPSTTTGRIDATRHLR